MLKSSIDIGDLLKTSFLCALPSTVTVLVRQGHRGAGMTGRGVQATTDRGWPGALRGSGGHG